MPLMNKSKISNLGTKSLPKNMPRNTNDLVASPIGILRANAVIGVFSSISAQCCFGVTGIVKASLIHFIRIV